MAFTDYHNSEQVLTSRRKILEKIEAQVSFCPTSFILIDEVVWYPWVAADPSQAQLAAPGVFECLLDVLGHRQPIQAASRSVDYRKSIFVFTTNTGGAAADKLVRHNVNWKSSHVLCQTSDLLTTKRRNAITYDDFQINLRERLSTMSKWLSFKVMMRSLVWL